MTGTRRFENITPILSHLHWLLVCFRAQFKVLVLTYKALHGLGPQYLMERLSQHEPTRTLRSTTKTPLRFIYLFITFLYCPIAEAPWEGKLGGRQQGRGPFQWWPPNYGMISPKRLAWRQHCYLPGEDLPLLPGSKQHVLRLLTDPRIVVLKGYCCLFVILGF